VFGDLIPQRFADRNTALGVPTPAGHTRAVSRGNSEAASDVARYGIHPLGTRRDHRVSRLFVPAAVRDAAFANTEHVPRAARAYQPCGSIGNVTDGALISTYRYRQHEGIHAMRRRMLGQSRFSEGTLHSRPLAMAVSATSSLIVASTLGAPA
jgi:hypothetical protein